jgi:hypothetical protein
MVQYGKENHSWTTREALVECRIAYYVMSSCAFSNGFFLNL